MTLTHLLIIKIKNWHFGDYPPGELLLYAGWRGRAEIWGILLPPNLPEFWALYWTSRICSGFFVGFSKFIIIKFKLRICINYRLENITGNPPTYKLSCNPMERFLQPSQCAMESLKMTYSDVMILKVYEWNTWIKHSIRRSSEVMILYIQSAGVEYIYIL